MGSIKFTNIPTTIKQFAKLVEVEEEEADEETDDASVIIMEEHFKRTPVWSGETVRNYAWGKNRKPSGGKKAAINNGPTGQTGFMPLGAEPRRGPNEEAAMGELRALLKDKELGDMFMTNLIEPAKWDLIDNGSAPTPDRARNPGGVSKIALQTAKARIGGEFA